MIGIILDCIDEVSQNLGNYYKENIYQAALVAELQLRGFMVRTEVIVPIFYKKINVGYERADIVIYRDSEIFCILELKSQNTRINTKEINQLRKYLLNLQCDIGLLINFYDNLEVYQIDKINHKKICSDTYNPQKKL